MRNEDRSERRIRVGQVGKDTRGATGPYMETGGLWTKPGLQG